MKLQYDDPNSVNYAGVEKPAKKKKYPKTLKGRFFYLLRKTKQYLLLDPDFVQKDHNND